MHIANFITYTNPESYNRYLTVKFDVCRDKSDGKKDIHYGEYVLYFNTEEKFVSGKIDILTSFTFDGETSYNGYGGTHEIDSIDKDLNLKRIFFKLLKESSNKSEKVKKEKMEAKNAENSIHADPLVLVANSKLLYKYIFNETTEIEYHIFYSIEEESIFGFRKYYTEYVQMSYKEAELVADLFNLTSEVSAYFAANSVDSAN